MLAIVIGLCVPGAECSSFDGGDSPIPDMSKPMHRDGRVISGIDGMPLAGATVAVYFYLSPHRLFSIPVLSAPLQNATTTDADGRFSALWPLDVVPPFMLDMVAIRAPGHASIVCNPLGRKDNAHGLIILPPAATLAGRVVDMEGNPIGNARIAGTKDFADGLEGYLVPFVLPQPVQTDSSGRFVMSDLAAGGLLRISTEAAGHIASTTTLLVDKAPQEIEIRLMKAPAQLPGVLLSADGKPLAGHPIMILGAGPRRPNTEDSRYKFAYRTVTDPAGGFLFDQLDGGEWTLLAGHPQEGLVLFQWDIDPIQTTEVCVNRGSNPLYEFRLEKPKTITMTFVDAVTGEGVEGVIVSTHEPIPILPAAGGPRAPASTKDGRVDLTLLGMSAIRYFAPEGYRRGWVSYNPQSQPEDGMTYSIKLEPQNRRNHP